MKNITVNKQGILGMGTAFRVEIHLFLIPLIFSALWGNYLLYFFIGWGSALTHEFCHVLAGRRMGIGVSGIRLLPFGVCAPLKEPFIKEPEKEILMALAGPLWNLFLAGLGYGIFCFYPHDLLSYGIAVNLSMAVLNLFPCLPLDGGRILRCLLTLGSNAISAYRITLTVSRVLAAVLFGLGILFLLTASFQFSLLMIGAFLLGNLLTEQKQITLQMLRELLYYRKKADTDRLNKTLMLTADQNLPARHLLRKLSYHRYLLITVIDEQQHILKTLTETQVLEALFRQGIRTKLGEIKA